MMSTKPHLMIVNHTLVGTVLSYRAMVLDAGLTASLPKPQCKRPLPAVEVIFDLYA